jgi:hypothetical protein
MVMVTATSKEMRTDLVKRMEYWQAIERRSVASATAVLEKTNHPLLRLVMEIIQRDSQIHERVQQFIIDSVDRQPVTLRPEEMGDISALLDAHLRLEDQMAEAVNATIEHIRGHKMLVEEYLLDFLVQDERKHATMLRSLDKVKRGLYPYA